MKDLFGLLFCQIIRGIDRMWEEGQEKIKNLKKELKFMEETIEKKQIVQKQQKEEL